MYAEEHPIMKEADYPYLATDGHLCHNKDKAGVVIATDGVRVESGSSSQLMAAIK